MSEAEAAVVQEPEAPKAEPEAAAAPAAEPEAAPAAEPEAAPAAEPEPEAAPEPAEAPEEEVKAAALYKNNKHKELKEGGPFDPKAEGNHPSLGGDSNLVDKFLKSSTLWVCYSAAHKKHDFLEFVAMGNSIA